MLTNPVSKIFVVLAVLSAALATLSFVDQPALSKAESSEPARTVNIPMPGVKDLSDYFLRLGDRTAEAASVSIPVTGANNLSDYYQRQAGMGTISVGKDVDLSWPPRPDFSILRQSAIIPVSGDQAYSDFHARHPELSTNLSAVADLSDYALRHPAPSKSSGAVDTSDYFLRH
jgi:hypothetical protein